MIIRSHTFKRVTIVGVGLMGGSLGMAIKKHNLAREVVGLANRQSALLEAIKMKAIDVALTDIPKAIRNSDLVVLATPVDSIIKLLPVINPHLKRGCIVTDLGSTKAEIIDSAQSILTHSSFFVGSHPLVGSEKKGINFAREDLFEHSQCIMTPTKETNQVAKEKVKHFWTKVGAKVEFMLPEEHDEVLAYVSHLPHLLAYGLIETIPQKYLDFATRGLKDTTRIASSSPQVWNDICLSNSKNLLKSLDELTKHLHYLRKAILNSDEKSLLHHFTKSKEKRDGIE